MEKIESTIGKYDDVFLIWLDENIDDTSIDCQNTLTQFRRAINTINTFTDSNECIQFIQTIKDNKACMIISDSLGQYIVPLIHNMSQVDSIFIFCDNKQYHEQWTKDWFKIEGVFTEILSICEALKKVSQQYEQNAMPMSFIGTSGDLLRKNVDQLDWSFMYTQLLKEILLTIKFDQNHMQELIDYCRNIYAKNEDELNNIKKFEKEYHEKTPIWWYSYPCFLYRILNHALRTADVDKIIKVGFFIDKLYHHIEKLHSEQFNGNHSGETFTVYRGQAMSKVDFEQMTKTKGGLTSFNYFLSTSKNRKVSLKFAGQVLSNPDLMGILFVMVIDPSISTTPFASIKDVSSLKAEDEILFSTHTVFRICDIKPINENNRLFEVNLTLTSDNDKDLRVLTDRIREETKGSTGWYRLGELLLKMRQSKKAQELYEVLLDQTTDEVEKGHIYKQLGCAKNDQGEYKEAIKFLRKSIEIYQKTPTNHINLAVSYNEIGNVYYNVGEGRTALLYYEKALAIKRQSLPSNHSDLATYYNNIGAAHDSMGDYSRALSYYEKALAIRQQSLPSNHPDLGVSYNNIGSVSHSMSDYEKALFSYEKSLAIQQQSLPSNHPDLATSYNNIGSLYHKSGEYSKALLSYQSTLEIQKQLLPSNHFDLAMSYNNIGLVYYHIIENSKALSSFEKALEIKQRSLPSNHLDLAMCYANISSVYSSMGENSKALSLEKKILEIKEQLLPPNHPDLTISYENVGSGYDKTGDYSKAIMYNEKALEIQQQQSFSSNQWALALSYDIIGCIYNKMGEYSRALSYFEKVLEIQQQLLSPDDPDLAKYYNNISVIYKNMGEYLKACSFCERAVDIEQRSSPSNNPNLEAYTRNLNLIKKKL